MIVVAVRSEMFGDKDGEAGKANGLTTCLAADRCTRTMYPGHRSSNEICPVEENVDIGVRYVTDRSNNRG